MADEIANKSEREFTREDLARAILLMRSEFNRRNAATDTARWSVDQRRLYWAALAVHDAHMADGATYAFDLAVAPSSTSHEVGTLWSWITSVQGLS